MSYQQVIELIGDRIDRFGWTTIAVETAPGDPPWQYTVGLGLTYGLPELVTVGSPHPEHAYELFPKIIDRMVTDWGDDVPAEAEFDGYTWALRAVHGSHWTGDRFAKWVDYHGETGQFIEPRAIQAFFRDRFQGLYPWEPGINPRVRKLQTRLDLPLKHPVPPRQSSHRRKHSHRK
jgi:hypothetical protein